MNTFHAVMAIVTLSINCFNGYVICAINQFPRRKNFIIVTVGKLEILTI